MNKPAAEGRSNDSDRAALIALYQDTDGANWTMSQNWTTDAPIGEWHGVTTDGSGRVTELSLQNNRLQGEFPVSLARLANLQLLDLSDNKLYGKIPAEFGRIGSLEMLVISENPLSGCIPTELRKLPDSDLGALALPYCDDTGPTLTQKTQDAQLHMPDHLRGLDEQQRTAVTHVDGPLLILAGPGSGKTRVITHRVANLVATGVAPKNILAVTFTKNAAAEMQRRVHQMIDPATGRVNIGTFHSQALRILKRDIHYLGRERTFQIYDEAKQRRLIRQAMKDKGIRSQEFSATAINTAISCAKDNLETPEMYAKHAVKEFEKTVARVYHYYQRLLENANAVDFGDMLALGVRLLQTFPSVRAIYRNYFRFILVDEYQDINRAQYEFLRALAAGHGNICVVGDDDQNIYAWRGSDIRYIKEFQSWFPTTDVVRLERNYRSTKNIVACANAVISNATKRIVKHPWTERETGEHPSLIEVYDEHEEAREVRALILDLRNQGFACRDIAVIYRTNAQSRPLEVEFVQNSLPYRLVKAKGFYARTEVRHVLTYLRALADPRDLESFERIATIPSRRVSVSTLQTLRAWAKRDGLASGEWVRQLATDAEAASRISEHAAAGELLQIGRLLCRMDKLAGNEVVSQLIDTVVQNFGYAEMLDNDPYRSEERWENVRELRNAATKHDGLGPRLSLERFLAEADLVSSVDNPSSDRDAVTLVTAHSAKGLEFPVVIIIGLEEELFPHIRNLDNPVKLDEERRLAYVAITRAKDRLFLTYSRHRLGKDLRNPSRFLQEMPPELLAYRGRLEAQQSIVANSQAPVAMVLSGQSPELSSLPKTAHAFSFTLQCKSPSVPQSESTRVPVEATQSGTSDRAALVALYSATNGPRWTNRSNWLSDKPISEWNGVTTDQTGRVIALELSRSNLRGRIPLELGSLTNLEQLFLVDNHLSGAIPTELGRLTNLRKLSLFGNQLSGNIPSELELLTNLELLYLAPNQLSGCIPPELQGIPYNDLCKLGLPFRGR